MFTSQVLFESYAAIELEIGHLREDNPLGTSRALKLLNPISFFHIDLTKREPAVSFQNYDMLLYNIDKTELIEAREILTKDQDTKL
jgi:hypothetical protein